MTKTRETQEAMDSCMGRNNESREITAPQKANDILHIIPSQGLQVE